MTSRSEAKTKRRKVWVNLYEDGEHYAYSRKAECKDAMAEAAHARGVPFIESRPGDVVLSREDVERLRDMAWGLAGDHRRAMLNLLRGGR